MLRIIPLQYSYAVHDLRLSVCLALLVLRVTLHKSRHGAFRQDVFPARPSSGAYNYRRLSAGPDAPFPVEFASTQAKSHNTRV